MYRSKNLEIHTVDHCNLDCVGCSHESPLMAHRFENVDVLAQSLAVLWRHYRAPLVKLLGGEPLLHPSIAEIISAAKEATGSTIRLVTNGVLLTRKYKLLHGIDEIYISSYASAPIPSEEVLQEIAFELRVPVTINSFEKFRWHRTLPRTDGKATELVFSTCQQYHAWECHTLRDGRLYPCPPCGTWGKGEGVDLLHGCDDYGKAITELLTRRTALGTCSECLGTVGHLFDHRLGWKSGRDQIENRPIDTSYAKLVQIRPFTNSQCFDYLHTIYP